MSNINLVCSELKKSHKFKGNSNFQEIMFFMLRDKYLNLYHSLIILEKTGSLTLNLLEKTIETFSVKNKEDETLYNEIDNFIEIYYDHNFTNAIFSSTLYLNLKNEVSKYIEEKIFNLYKILFSESLVNKE